MKRRGIFFLALLLLWTAPVLAAAPLKAGDYTISVTMTGGTGRASITSPAPLTVTDKGMTATLVWSSPNYTYMRLDSITYRPIQTQGNSTFEIPITLDADIPFSAETIAMSQPHEIDYVLHFDSSTLKPVGEAGTPLPAILVVCGGAVVLLAVLAVRKKRARA